jgi:hypothetical protein
MSDVDRNVWIRTFGAPFKASHARSISSGRALAKLQMVGPSTSWAIRLIASKSPGELNAKPASMISTPSRASCLAIMTFSSMFMLAPGDCSPSRRVVSKILIMRVIAQPSSSVGPSGPALKQKAFFPKRSGTKACALRGTTLIQRPEFGHPSFRPVSGVRRDPLGPPQTATFTGSALRRVQRRTG